MMPRLIDADALERDIRKDAYCLYEADDAIAFVRDAPTIDAELVRHGHWIVKVNPNWRAYTIHECSVCGYYIHDSKLTKRDTLNYCQNCGAKMDEPTIYVGLGG